MLLVVLLLSLLPLPKHVVAQNISCAIDQGNTTPGGAFDFNAWIQRGSCIHYTEGFEACRNSLQFTLDSLDSLHAAEYSAGATILTLLPTLGALFGTTTSDIWILLQALPFGGVMALLLSLGGSMMPAKLGAYQDNTTTASSSERSGQAGAHGNEARASSASDPLDRLSKRVADQVQASQRKELSLLKVLTTLFVMIVLLSGSLAGMGIIEYGAIYMTWCTSLWWFHAWFITLTAVAVADSWASLPFDHFAKLYVSDLRNDYEVQGGRSFLSDPDDNGNATKAEIITANLRQLVTLEPGNLKIVGSFEPTPARNRLLILISVARDGPDRLGGPRTSLIRYATQIFFKLAAVTIYVFATSVFAAVVLLALPMAQMILMLLVGSGILGRVLVGNMVSAVKQQASFIHIIADSEQEAAGFVARIFEDQNRPGIRTRFQIELDGHVFVDQVRVKSRSPLWVWMLGVLAPPYDLTSLVQGYAPLDRKLADVGALQIDSV